MRDEHARVSRYLHFLLIISMLFQFGSYYAIKLVEALAPYKGLLYMLHKSTGALSSAIIIALILSQFLSGRPNHALPKWQHALAWFAKLGLYVSVLTMTMSGYIMSSASGRGYAFYGLFDVPLMIPQNKVIAGMMRDLHGYVSYIFLAFLALHLLGAIYHRFIVRDQIVQSMVRL